MSVIQVRDATAADANELCELINEIINIGGTTAHQALFNQTRFIDHYIEGQRVRSCVVAVGPDGGLLGFQVITEHDQLPPDCGDIGTFARASSIKRGVGTALFVVTRAKAEGMGLTSLNATIRVDNVGGHAYYAKMGFEIYHVDVDVPLRDGTRIDRISRRLLLV
jgi:RimJ/RimL family protein N-acetyltransferase